MAYKEYHIKNLVPAITRKIFNNIGFHNEFIMVLNAENHYPGKKNPVILRYEGNQKKWIYVADKTIFNFYYVREVIEYNNGKFVLKHLPLDGAIWDIILDPDTKNEVEVDTSKLTIRNNVVTGLDEKKSGYVEVMYCVGTKTDDSRTKVNNVINNINIAADTVKVGTGIGDDELAKLEKEEEVVYDTDIKTSKYVPGEKVSNVTLPQPEKKLKAEDVVEHLDVFKEKMNNIKETRIHTIKRTKISNGKIRLPSYPLGDAIHNMAHIFNTDDEKDLFLREASCKIVGRYVKFDNKEEVEGLYAVVSYLTEA